MIEEEKTMKRHWNSSGAIIFKKSKTRTLIHDNLDKVPYIKTRKWKNKVKSIYVCIPVYVTLRPRSYIMFNPSNRMSLLWNKRNR